MKSFPQGPLRGTPPTNKDAARVPNREAFRGVELDAGRRTILERDGVLHVPGALSPELLARVRSSVDKLYERAKAKGWTDKNGYLFLTNCVVEDDIFLEVMENPAVFPLVWDILGWNIFLYHSHLNVTPPLPPEAGRERKTLGWHQDSGRVNMDLEEHPRPRVSLKVAFWLTDTLADDCANMWVIPGRMRDDNLKLPEDKSANPPGAMPIKARAGDATFFERRTWHAASPNWSQLTRKVLFMGYGYRWIRAKDRDDLPSSYLKRLDPVQRQMLGEGPWPNARFSPDHPDAVPLHALIRKIRGENAVGNIPWGR